MPNEINNPMDDPNTIQDFEKKYLSMATEDFNNNFVALLRTRTNVIYISTNEEKRLLNYLYNVSIARGYAVFEWDCFRLLRELKPKDPEKVALPPGTDGRYPESILSFIIEEIEKKGKKKDDGNGTIYVLCDFYRYLSPERCTPQIERQLKYINRLTTNNHVILTGPTYISNSALEKEIAVLDFPFPNEQEIRSILLKLVKTDKVQTGFPEISSIVKKHQEELINSVKGLTTTEANQAYAKSIVMSNQLGTKPLDIEVILQEKKQIIKKTDILEYVDSSIEMKDVGGLEVLTRWLDLRKLAFMKEAADYGLKPPRGVLLLGAPGCGKSLTAKAAARLYEMPLLRLDFGKMFGSLVGESEKIARHAIKLAETVAPCVAGDSIIYDSDGKPYKIEDLIDTDSKKLFHTYSFNENSWKMELTRVNAVIKHAEKKKMLELITPVGSIRVTEDHKMMVNRDGELVWIAASKLTTDDLLITPKTFKSQKKTLDMKKVFPKKDKNISIRVGGKMHAAVIENTVTDIIRLSLLCGMMDSCGSYDVNTGDILFSSKDKRANFFFAAMLSETFLTEPSIKNDMVILKNKVVAKFMSEFFTNIHAQPELVLSFYVGGFFKAGGSFGFMDTKKTKPFASFQCNTNATFERIKTALHAFSIIPYRINKACLILENDSIETLFTMLPVFSKALANSIDSFMTRVCDKVIHNVDIVGYQIGKSLSNIKNTFRIKELDYNGYSMNHYENSDIFMHYSIAAQLHDFLKTNLPVGDLGSFARLVESDVVGVKIDAIRDVGMQWAYDLSCEKNHNFFANGFLCHNCILWADEIEKGLAGGVGAGSGDSGTTKRVIGTFLTWLQEKQAPVFVICTANNVQDIPPEFMRAGRFDEVFFVDLPNTVGRKQIYEVLLKKFRYNPEKFDLESLAGNTDGFSGAEIEKTIENAMFECFCDNKRPVDTRDLLLSCKSICPLSSTRSEEFAAMRQWARGRCKFANTKDDNIVKSSQEDIPDIDV